MILFIKSSLQMLFINKTISLCSVCIVIVFCKAVVNMQSHVASAKEHVATSSLPRGWKILIIGCLLLNVLVVVALCFLTIDYQNYKSKCSCGKVSGAYLI